MSDDDGRIQNLHDVLWYICGVLTLKNNHQHVTKFVHDAHVGSAHLRLYMRSAQCLPDI